MLSIAIVFAAALAVAPGDARVRPGKWNKGKVPDGWVVVETEHYHVQGQCGREKTERLAEYLEHVMELYKEFLPFRKEPKQFVLKIFADREGYLAYGAPPSSAAYYSQGDRELVAYDTGAIAGVLDVEKPYWIREDLDLELTDAEIEELARLLDAIGQEYTMDVAGILAHEGWHQYFHHYTVSWVAMPSWLDEGVGDYFYSASRDPQTGEFELGALNNLRLRNVRYAFEDGTAVDFETLMGFEQRDYYSNASVYYAQGWSMVQFLMHHDDPAYRQLIPKLIEDFKQTKNFRKSTDEVFEDVDLVDLDREWIGWVLTREMEDPMAELAERFGTVLLPEDLVGSDRFATERIRAVYTDRLERAGIEIEDE